MLERRIVYIESKEQEKEFNLKESFVLWKEKSKAGINYLKGFTSLDKNKKRFRLVGFYNTIKKNLNEPDIRIYNINEEGKKEKKVCDLWETVSKKEKRYLTGKTAQDKKIIAFYTEEQNIEGTRPYIRAYFKD